MSDATNGQGVIRLSLNVPAVERLIAGDQELEIHLREQVKKQVFGNMANNLADTAEVKALVEQVRLRVSDVVKDELEKRVGATKNDFSTNYKPKFTVSPVFKEQLNSVIDKMVEPMVTELVKERVNRTIEVWGLLTDERLKQLFDIDVERRIKKGIDERLAAAARASQS
jgi:hypothetical protein